MARVEQDIFNDLALLCASPGYAHAIAYFCFRDHVVRYGDAVKGEDYAKLFSFERLIRTEISTLIGLMIRKPWDPALPDPGTLQTYIERTETLLKELHEVMEAPANAELRAALADPAKSQSADPFNSAAVLREPIFYGSESAYSFQYRDLAILKYARDEEWLKTNKGFSPTEAKKVLAAISDFLNGKLLETLKGLKLLSPEQWAILDGFQFTTADIVAKSGLPVETVDAVLVAFRFPENGNPTFFALPEFNAANAFPILKGEGDKHVLFLYVSLAEAFYEAPFYWMSGDKAYESTAMTNRGRFTEEFSAARLTRVFGSSKVFQNVDIWSSKARKRKIGEIDTLVLFGDRAIVLQAKSKRLTLAARKGNDLQLQSDFRAAVQEACDQALACSDQLLARTASFSDKNGNEIAIPAVKQIHPLCVVSDHYPALSFQARQFLRYKATDAIKAPLVCDVFFIDVVTEFLETPLRFLSYLELRARAGDNLSFSHEITALGYHLKRNLWLGEYDFMVLEDDLSIDVDIAMAVRRDGVEGEKTPPGILTILKGMAISRIIEQIEHRTESGAISVGLELLKLSGDSARDLSLAIDRIVADTAKDKRHHDVTVASSKAASGITIHCNDLPEAVAGPNLRQHCELRKYSTKADTWCGLTIAPATGAVRFGGMISYPWEQDGTMDAAVADMPEPQPIRALKAFAKRRDKRRKIGRNDPCPCGSGLKYKRCHLAKGEPFSN